MRVDEERGFVLVTVLVILAAIALLSLAIVDHASLISRVGAMSVQGERRTLSLRNAIHAVAAGNLPEGVYGGCVDGVCGRASSGNYRLWDSEQVAAEGIAVGEGSTDCTAVVVAEFLGIAASQRFWRILATCKEPGGASGLLSGFVTAEDGNLRSIEWTAN